MNKIREVLEMFFFKCLKAVLYFSEDIFRLTV